MRTGRLPRRCLGTKKNSGGAPPVVNLISSCWFLCGVCQKYHPGRTLEEAERAKHPDLARNTNATSTSASASNHGRLAERRRATNKGRRKRQRLMKADASSGSQASRTLPAKSEAEKAGHSRDLRKGEGSARPEKNTDEGVKLSPQQRTQPKRTSKEKALSMIYLSVNALK